MLGAQVRPVYPPNAQTRDAAYEYLEQVMDKYHNRLDVFTDLDAGGNHFIPSGWIGDYGDIRYSASVKDTACGLTSIRLVYAPGTAPLNAWAGIYWQTPGNQLGDSPAAYNLTGATELRFKARGQYGGEKAEFLLGGINRQPNRDSAKSYQDSYDTYGTGIVTLDSDWQEYCIDLISPTWFYIYSDQSASRNNHYVPTGWFHTGWNMSLDEGWTVDPYQGSTCIRYFWDGIVPPGTPLWAGILWQHPGHNWLHNRPGYNLEGADSLIFYARCNRDTAEVDFMFGSPYDSCGQTKITSYLDRQWRKYSIALPDSGLSDVSNAFGFTIRSSDYPDGDSVVLYFDEIYVNKRLSKDLSHMIGGFCWVTDTASNPNGATIYVDDIRFNLPRLDSLRLLTSYESAVYPYDAPVMNMANTYDNALAMLAFTARGDLDGVRRARIIGDALAYAQTHDRFFGDGRLRNAYMSGDPSVPMNPNVRLPGWWDESNARWFENTTFVSTHTGNVAWAILAWMYFDSCTGSTRYRNNVIDAAHFVVNHCFDSAGIPGFTGGYETVNDTLPVRLTYKSTEHNIDLYAAFTKLAAATGDQQWTEWATRAKVFVDAMWYEDAGFYWTGTREDGATINTDVIPLDPQTWSYLSDPSERNRRAVEYAYGSMAVEEQGYAGFDFNNDRDGIWWEGTAQMAAAFGVMSDTLRYNKYIGELERAQAQAPRNNGKGIVAANRDNVTTGFDWMYHNRLHVGATAWYIFASAAVNPFDPIATGIQSPPLPSELWLSAAPNPFGGATLVTYSLPKTEHSAIRVYDLRGGCAATLVEGVQPAGKNAVFWDGIGRHGAPLPNGAYLCTMIAGSQMRSVLLILMR